MSADGTWNVTMNSPMGPQKCVLVLNTDGGSLSGTLTTPMGEIPVLDGAADGDHLTWKGKMTVPMPMDLEFSADVAGDAISGSIGMGPMGDSSFEGTRG